MKQTANGLEEDESALGGLCFVGEVSTSERGGECVGREVSRRRVVWVRLSKG